VICFKASSTREKKNMHFYNLKNVHIFFNNVQFFKKNVQFFKKCIFFVSRVDEAYKDEIKLIWNFFILSLYQGCTTRISWRAKKMLLRHSRARLVKFFLFYKPFTSKIKPNICKLGLWGPDSKLLQATFGPRAVSCACLV